MKLVGNNIRCGKTLRILQEYEKQKAEGKTCKLVTKEDMKKEKRRKLLMDIIAYENGGIRNVQKERE